MSTGAPVPAVTESVESRLIRAGDREDEVRDGHRFRRSFLSDSGARDGHEADGDEECA
jgi:hypothetical protein